MTNFSEQTNHSPSPVDALAEQAQDMSNQVQDQVQAIPERAEQASDQVADQIASVKATVTKPLPTPPAMSTVEAPPQELLKRLNWGEPALTIIDVRSRDAFNDERITGAVPMPMDQLLAEAESALEYSRDIYVYGDGNAAEAASQLRQAGYAKVALLQGGLAAWKAIGGATEGVSAFSSPVRS